MICVPHIQSYILQNTLFYYPRFGLCQNLMTNEEKNYMSSLKNGLK